jgi:hypothetical protein
MAETWMMKVGVDGWIRLLRGSVHPFTVYLFTLGASSGFLAALFCPGISDLYLALYSGDVRFYGFQLMVEHGLMGVVLAVFTRNMFLASLLTLAPYFISSSYRGDGRGLYVSLTAFTVCATLAYGFAPYGLMLGHLYTHCEVDAFLRWILYLAPHAPLETSVILYAASHSLQVRDILLGRRIESKRSLGSLTQVSGRLFTSGIALLAAAFLEAYVSPILLRPVKNGLSCWVEGKTKVWTFRILTSSLLEGSTIYG